MAAGLQGYNAAQAKLARASAKAIRGQIARLKSAPTPLRDSLSILRAEIALNEALARARRHAAFAAGGAR